MKKILLLSLSTFLLFAFTTNHEEEAKINAVLDAWHKAAAEAQFDTYFSLMTPNGVFIGTDATENWQNDAFRAFAKPFFEKGKAWDFKVLERHIYFSKDHQTAWFDELLDTQMKICRGSGVLVKSGKQWKIAHYVLSMTVPNDKTNEVVKAKDKIETELIQQLKNKGL